PDQLACNVLAVRFAVGIVHAFPPDLIVFLRDFLYESGGLSEVVQQARPDGFFVLEVSLFQGIEYVFPVAFVYGPVQVYQAAPHPTHTSRQYKGERDTGKEYDLEDERAGEGILQ